MRGIKRTPKSSNFATRYLKRLIAGEKYRQLSVYVNQSMYTAPRYGVRLVFLFFVDTVYMYACQLAHENKYLCRLLPVSAYNEGCLTSNYQSKWKN